VEHRLSEAFALTLRRHADGGVPTNPMGLGWILAPLGTRTVAMHDGRTYGFAGSIVLDPAGRRAGIALANAAGSVNDLALHALEPSIAPHDLEAERRQTERSAVAVDPAALAPLVGVYALEPLFKVNIRVREGRVFAQATG
jgi:hypothetical protein